MGLSLRKAINAKCKDCIYDSLSESGTWRQQTGACPSEDCPLWPVRPKSSVAASGTEQDTTSDDKSDESDE